MIQEAGRMGIDASDCRQSAAGREAFLPLQDVDGLGEVDYADVLRQRGALA